MSKKNKHDCNKFTMSVDKDIIELEHHKQQSLCITRPAYRQGRKLTAIKTYTVNSESQYLLIFGVPSVNLRPELKVLCQKYGAVLLLVASAEHPSDEFTECFKVKYGRVQSARVAKRALDTKNFFGGVLHVCYAPECETIAEIRSKLQQRRIDVLKRLRVPHYLNINYKNSNKYIATHHSGNTNDISVSETENTDHVETKSIINVNHSQNGCENHWEIPSADYDVGNSLVEDASDKRPASPNAEKEYVFKHSKKRKRKEKTKKKQTQVAYEILTDSVDKEEKCDFTEKTTATIGQVVTYEDIIRNPRIIVLPKYNSLKD